MGTVIGLIAFMVAICVARTATAQGLGFTIDPTQGVPGTVVNGQVDVDDIAASCTTDLAAFQARFAELLSGPFAGGSVTGELFQRFFPGQTDFIFENCDQLAYSITGITGFAIAENFNGAAETAFPQTFVMTFADLATQDPLGPLGSFDPTTGVGSVVAPDLTPGPYPVVATCVGTSLNLDVLETGIRETGDFLRSIGLTDEICDPNIPEFAEFIEEFLGPGADLFVFLETIGPTVVQNIAVFDALGIQVFTILPQPADRIADLLEDIDALVAGGQLKANHARGITRHLRNALRKLDRGKLGPACAQLDAFIKVVNAKVKAKALDPAAAPPLIAEAESIQEQLGCGVGGSPSGAFLDGSEGHF
jgi:hypothetical protein